MRSNELGAFLVTLQGDKNRTLRSCFSSRRTQVITPAAPADPQFRNWVPELPLPLTYLDHGGGLWAYTPLSASTSSKKLIPSWRLRQHAPGASRGLKKKQPSVGRWWGVVMVWLPYSGWF
jgi:hypothetical protein